jgi:hypothetical protein
LHGLSAELQKTFDDYFRDSSISQLLVLRSDHHAYASIFRLQNPFYY